MQLTIATWNIAGGHTIHNEEQWLAYNPEDVEYFVRELKDVSPDIVCLQETHIDSKRSIAGEIANEIGDFFCFEQNNSLSHINPEYRLGNAILSKYSFRKKDNFTLPSPNFPLKLPNDQDRHDKGFQVVEFDFGTLVNIQILPLKFLGTPYDTENGVTFAHQMEATLLSKKQTPLIVCGDFNYDRASDLYQEFLGDLRNALPQIPTRPGNRLSDYIFYSQEFTLLDAQVVTTNTDHYLCWAKFEV